MDFPELTKLAFLRVQQMEPHNVGRILGCILLHEPDEDEMVQLAYGNDAAVLARITDAKATLAAIYARCSLHHQIGAAAQRAAAAASVRHQHHLPAAAYGFPQYWGEHAPPAPKAAQQQQEFSLVDAAAEGGYALPPQSHGGGLDDHHHYDYDAAAGGYYYAAAEDAAFHNGGGAGCPPPAPAPRAASRRANGGLSTARRACHYFIKGMCKNGQNCHYSHHQAYSDGFAADDDGGHHHNTPGALEKLELEIIELLNSRHGQPLSIASLPTLYVERYGKSLQAEGYLTESQRHGKAGYSLTKLLSRLNKIRVIERPHGQHSVVLAEDAARYTEFRGERGGGEMGSVPASSHQIYLTFPAESTFIEEDVATYFGQYGPVRDVRIPCQDRRMFGFVSFQNPETVSTILMRRNPHWVCGSRVLVKPYREKSKCIERSPRSYDKTKPSSFPYYPRSFVEIDPNYYSDEYEASNRLVRKQFAEKRERMMELNRKRLAAARLDSLPQQPFAFFDCRIEDVNPPNCVSADSKVDVADLMDHPLMTPDSLEIVVSTSQAPQTQASNSYDDKESNNQIELPESPFASAVPAGNSISTIM